MLWMTFPPYHFTSFPFFSHDTGGVWVGYSPLYSFEENIDNIGQPNLWNWKAWWKNHIRKIPGEIWNDSQISLKTLCRPNNDLSLGRASNLDLLRRQTSRQKYSQICCFSQNIHLIKKTKPKITKTSLFQQKSAQISWPHQRKSCQNHMISAKLTLDFNPAEAWLIKEIIQRSSDPAYSIFRKNSTNLTSIAGTVKIWQDMEIFEFFEFLMPRHQKLQYIYFMLSRISLQGKIIANWNYFERKLFKWICISMCVTEKGCFSLPEIAEYSFNYVQENDLPDVRTKVQAKLFLSIIPF